MIKNILINLIESFWEIVRAFTEGLYVEFHRGHIMRRGILAIATYIQVHALFWCFEYASTSPHEPLAIAAVIGAIMAPVSTLLGAAIKFYNEGRKNQNDEGDDK